MIDNMRAAGADDTNGPLTRQLTVTAGGCVALYLYAALPASQLQGGIFCSWGKEEAMYAAGGGGGTCAIR